MITLASGLSYLDLHFYGVKGVIASVILHGPGGAAIIDPGPSSTLPALRAGLDHAGIPLGEVRTILSAKDYLLSELTGLRLTEPSTAAGFGIYNQPDGSWKAELRDALFR